MSIDWVGWLTAVGTVGTCGIAVFVLVRDQQRLRSDAQAARRAQASQVSAWAWSDPPNSWFEVVNSSDLPVYDLVILADSWEIAKAVNLNMGSLSGKGSFKASLDTQSAFPGSDRKHAAPVCFIDAAGQRWLRDGLGILYDGTQANIEALEYPNGIVGGTAAAHRFYDGAATAHNLQFAGAWLWHQRTGDSSRSE